jgi:predicted dipeptidase
MIATVLALSLAATPTPPGAAVWAELQSRWRPRLEPLLSDALHYPTVHGDQEALAAQRQWLARVGPELGFVVNDRETMTEIDLPGPEGAPVLGLVVHGDVQPVNASQWTVPPFSGAVKGGSIWGRGAADDKGPMIQALLAMAALRTSGLTRTHTVRLLVGTDEEGGADDVDAYRKAHRLPDVSLVLDSDFPVVVGEKAWAEWIVTATERPGASSGPVEVADLEAGSAPSIVPDRAALKLRWRSGTPDWERWLAPVRAARLPPDTSLEVSGEGAERLLVVHGQAAHSGIALARGRNALFALAVAVHGRLPACAAADLLEYTRVAGADPRGGGLGLRLNEPLWGAVDTNFAQIMRGTDGRLALHVNLRSPPELWGEALKSRVDANAKAFAERTGARFETGGKFGYPPFAVPANAPLVQRLLAAYTRGTGKPAKPVVSAGGTYAGRMTNAVAFGMWFREDGLYPGHASDERVQIRSLERGMHVLAEALGDLATSPKIEHPLEAPKP